MPPAFGLAWKAGEGRGVRFACWRSCARCWRTRRGRRSRTTSRPSCCGWPALESRRGALPRTSCCVPSSWTPTPPAAPWSTLAQRRLDRKPGSSPEEQAACALELAGILGKEVDDRGLREFTGRMELPLVPVLARMERTGIRVDPAALKGLSDAHGSGNPAADRGDLRPGRPRFQHQLAAAARQGLVRRAGPARPGEIREDQDAFHRRRRAGGAGRRAPHRRQGARIPPTRQAEGHLRRMPCRL